MTWHQEGGSSLPRFIIFKPWFHQKISWLHLIQPGNMVDTIHKPTRKVENRRCSQKELPR